MKTKKDDKDVPAEQAAGNDATQEHDKGKKGKKDLSHVRWNSRPAHRGDLVKVRWLACCSVKQWRMCDKLGRHLRNDHLAVSHYQILMMLDQSDNGIFYLILVKDRLQDR